MPRKGKKDAEKGEATEILAALAAKVATEGPNSRLGDVARALKGESSEPDDAKRTNNHHGHPEPRGLHRHAGTGRGRGLPGSRRTQSM